MTQLQQGTYRGTADDLGFDIRVECDGDSKPHVISGDIVRGDEFVAAFLCSDPRSVGGVVEGPVIFRGNPELHTGVLRLDVDARGLGSFQLGVDLEGGHRDVLAGRLDWQGSYLRRILIEIDGFDGASPPAEYRTRGGKRMSIQNAFEEAGFDVEVRIDTFTGRASRKQRSRGWTLAEIHAAMAVRRDMVPADRLHAHVLVCSYLSGRGGKDVLGVMYDYGRSDLNRRPREGVAVFYDHPMLSDPRISENDRQREYVFTLVHEIGHALNMMHSFDKARPSSLSWMNYPNLYPRGYEAGDTHDGTSEFWRRFGEQFDPDELRHLRHATIREIRAAGFAFGTYEEGRSTAMGGAAQPMRTRLGGNPLRKAPAVNVLLDPVKREYDLGEPVFLSITAENRGTGAVHIPDALDPSEGYVRIFIRSPRGEVIQYKPPISMCKQAQLVSLPPQERLEPLQGTPLFLGAEGPMFTEPGVYQIRAEMTGIDGSRVAVSETTRLEVRPPDRATERFAHRLWDRPEAMQALYLRHPLAEREAWKWMQEELAGVKLSPENTSRSYVEYIAGMGWLTPFVTSDGGEHEQSLNKAQEHFSKVDTKHKLPTSVLARTEKVLKTKPAPEPAKRKRATGRGRVAGGVMPTRNAEQLRSEIPPAGLFGGLGLDVGSDGHAEIDPFVRIVPRLRGTRRFADIVSWNIEHLHGEDNWKKVPRIAELVRSFRCDFWGLQEVDERSLKLLVEALNSTGKTRYDFVSVKGRGQQSGAIYRTDTTRVRIRENLDPALFKGELTVTLSKENKKVKRDIFYRSPLVCDVHIRQAAEREFDFTCAVVHLKSTDQSLKDAGAGLRAAAAERLSTWMARELAAGAERDFLVMGDLNAEAAAQGLGKLADATDTRLLSVGMQDKYGKSQALTRVASKRLLDHIVVTGDAFVKMPKEDEDEQLIVRSDTEIGKWTSDYSDHVPIAVRFVLGKDAD